MSKGFIVGVGLGLIAFAVVWEFSRDAVAEFAGEQLRQNILAQIPPETLAIFNSTIGAENVARAAGNGFTLALKEKLP